MLPKNSKHYIVPTAEDLKMDVQLVSDVIAFYYSGLRKRLGSLAFHNIQVESLGVFSAMPNKLPELVKKYNKHLSVLDPEVFKQMTTKRDIESKLNKVKSLQKLITDDKNRKKEFLKKKYGNVK